MTKAKLATPVVLAVLALMVGVGIATAASPTTATIASADASGFRIAVTATKPSGGGGAPPATVYVTALERTGKTWKPLGRLRVGRSEGFFWKVVTGPHAVRQLSIDTGSPERVGLQLLLSPALGSSPVYHFHVANGRLVAG